MRLALMMALVVPGLLLLATPVLPVGLVLIWAGWWVYERSELPDSDWLITFLATLAGAGILSVYAGFLVEWIRRQ